MCKSAYRFPVVRIGPHSCFSDGATAIIRQLAVFVRPGVKVSFCGLKSSLKLTQLWSFVDFGCLHGGLNLWFLFHFVHIIFG